MWDLCFQYPPSDRPPCNSRPAAEPSPGSSFQYPPSDRPPCNPEAFYRCDAGGELSVSSLGSTSLQLAPYATIPCLSVTFSILPRIDLPATRRLVAAAVGDGNFQYPPSDRPPCNDMRLLTYPCLSLSAGKIGPYKGLWRGIVILPPGRGPKMLRPGSQIDDCTFPPAICDNLLAHSTSLQNRRNSQSTQGRRDLGGAGILSLSTISRIAATASLTPRRSRSVTMISSARRVRSE